MFKLHAEPFELLHNPVQDFDFDTQNPVDIEKEMITIMEKNNGIGLAANQIGLEARIFVMGSNRIAGFCNPQAFINPIIIKYSEDCSIDKEGCLSFPNLLLKVKRPVWVEAAYYNTKGELIEIRATGYMAKCFQHELDHLDGICFTNRVSRLTLDMGIKKLIKNHRR